MVVDTPHDSPLSRAGTLQAWALVCVSVALHLATTARHSLWNNEFITVRALRQGYGELIAERLASNHMPGYFVGLKAWVGIFGWSEWALRMPSTLFAIGGVLVLWRLGAYLLGRRGGLLVLALAGLHEVPLEMGNDARMYSALFFAASLALWALVRYLDDGGKRYLAALFLAGVVGISAQLLYLFVPVAVALYLLMERGKFPGRGSRALAAIAAPALLLLPIILWWAKVENKVGRSEWSAFRPSEACRQLSIMFQGDYSKLGWKAFQVVGVLLAVVAFGLTIRATRRARANVSPAQSPFRHASLLYLWILLPPICIAVAGLKSHHQFVGSWRYYVTTIPAASLLLALGWRALAEGGKPLLARVYAGAVLVVIVANTAGYLASPGVGARAVARHIRDHRLAGDVVVASRHKTMSEAFVYYGATDQVPHALPKETRKGGAETIRAWLGEQTQGHERLWVVFYEKRGRVALPQFLASHAGEYVPMGEKFKVNRTSVQLYVIQPRQSPSESARDTLP